MAVNARAILQQHKVQTDDMGRFAIDLPCGYYDLLFFDEIHEPLLLAGVAIEDDLVKEIVRPRAESSASTTATIHGTVSLADGKPAPGYALELHNGSASNCLASVVAGSDGGFEIGSCAYGYHLLLIPGQLGQNNWIPTPKPETSIEVNITLMDARPLERFVVTDPASVEAEAAQAGGTFTVCQDNQAHWFLTGGFMAPGSGPIGTNVQPWKVNIYVGTWLGIYAVYADRRAPTNPFAPAAAFGGYYWFTDESGDTYMLTAILPYLHSVSYSSAKPNITTVHFTQGIPYSGAWPGAPLCT